MPQQLNLELLYKIQPILFGDYSNFDSNDRKTKHFKLPSDVMWALQNFKKSIGFNTQDEAIEALIRRLLMGTVTLPGLMSNEEIIIKPFTPLIHAKPNIENPQQNN